MFHSPPVAFVLTVIFLAAAPSKALDEEEDVSVNLSPRQNTS
jgi:hypothetical protein